MKNKIGSLPAEELLLVAVVHVGWYEDICTGTMMPDVDFEILHPDFSNAENWQGPFPDRCDCCGHKVKWLCEVSHKPSKTSYWVGRTCAYKIGQLSQSKNAVNAATLRMTALRNAADKRRLFFKTAPEGVEEALEYATETEAPAILKDFRHQVGHYGQISERQSEIAVKVHREDLERREGGGAFPCSEERQTVSGTILSVKVKDHWRFGSQFKMVVNLGKGVRAYGTAPTPISGDDVGKEIQLTAKFEVSQKDPLFGFFSRPRINQ